MLFLLPTRPPPFEVPSLAYRILSSPLKFITQCLWAILLILRGPAYQAPPPSRRVRIVCISDTHTHKPSSLPDGDVLVHAGDLTNDGSAIAIQDQLDWLASLPYKHVIVIAGNHDSYFDPRSRRPQDRDTVLQYADHVHYLQHSSVRLDFAIPTTSGAKDGGVGQKKRQQYGNGALKKATKGGSYDQEAEAGARAPTESQTQKRSLLFHGSPQIPACGPASFAFQYPRHTDAWTSTVPDDIDVLITHTPPLHHLDLSQGLGCQYLLREIWRVRPRVHICGHVHAGYGRQAMYWDRAQEIYERLCSKGGDEGADGKERGLVRGVLGDVFTVTFGGAWLDLLRLIVRGSLGIIWTRVWGGDDGDRTGGVLINAALVYRSTGLIGNQAQVVDI